jgi:hypothetical protein
VVVESFLLWRVEEKTRSRRLSMLTHALAATAGITIVAVWFGVLPAAAVVLALWLLD